MKTYDLLDAQGWAERTFGGVQLHDMRRTRRAVQVASKLAIESSGFAARSNADVERE